MLLKTFLTKGRFEVACCFVHKRTPNAKKCDNRPVKNVERNSAQLHIGTAGWTIPKELKERFSPDGSHLERYSQLLTAVEINSSFYRPHQAKTYKRWAEETAAHLKFSVKMTKVFTHEKKLAIEPEELEAWLEPVKELGGKLGAILVQIPPKLEYDRETASEFFKMLREQTDTMIAFEPRHLSWTNKDALKLLDFYDVTKVEADPERCPSPPVKSRARYLRLHGSPQIYKSNYEDDALETLAAEIKPRDWVIFDNTTFGYATANALDLQALCSSSSRKFNRRKRGATTYIVPTVSKDMHAPKTAD